MLLERVRSASSIAARRYALDALARGLLGADPGSVDEQAREEAIRLRVDASTVAAASAPRLPHAVAVPLVATGQRFGFLRQLYVTFDPASILAEQRWLEAGAQRAIADAIAAAARRSPPPSEAALHRLVAAQPHALRGVRVDGRSLSAAAFVSATSLWTERPVRSDVAVTGELAGDRIASVGEIEAKVQAAIAHRVRALVVPAADAALARSACGGAALEIASADTIEALLDAALEPQRARVDPERAVEVARRTFSTGWRGYRWPSIAAELARLSAMLPAERLDLRVEVLARLAAAVRHTGDPKGSLEILREAETLVRSEEGRHAVPDAPISVLFQQLAMSSRQLCRFSEASRAAERAAAVAQRARLRTEHIKALGCAGLVAMSRGDVDRAIARFSEALEVQRRHQPEQTVRSHAYLIEAYGAGGRAEDARAHFDHAMAELDRSGGDRRSPEAWVRTSWGGALVALGRPDEAIAALDVASVRVSLAEDPLPGLLARRHLGVALARTGQERGFELLASSPLAHGRALEPHLAFVAHLNVLFEARERIAAGAWGSDIAGRAQRALEHVPRDAGVTKFLGRALDRTRRQLARRPSDTKSLDALLTRCVRLG